MFVCDYSLVCVGRLMIEYTTDTEEAAWKGYLYAGLLFVTAQVQSLILHQHWDVVFTMGMKVRSAIIGTVYNKVSSWWAWSMMVLNVHF